MEELVPQGDPDFSVVHTDRPGIRKVLGDLEAEVMELIWSRPFDAGTLVRDVFEVLYERRRIAYTTVMNTMTRLAKKGLLRVEKADQAYLYFPRLSQEEFVDRFVGHVLESLLVHFAGATRKGIAQLTNPAAATRAQQLLDEIVRRQTAEDDA